MHQGRVLLPYWIESYSFAGLERNRMVDLKRKGKRN